MTQAIEVELNVQQTRANEHKYEIERVQAELKKVNGTLYKSKKKEQYVKEGKANEHTLWKKTVNPPDKKFVGGGFNLMA